MKPEGRALEFVAVGLGQAGGNLAAEFQRRGYQAMALNTASTDLASLSNSGLSLPEAQRLYIGIDGHDGAGSDLDYGRECITVNAGRIRERVAEHCSGADVVVVTAGLGGGTGSAVSELIKTLEDLSLPTLLLATLPNDHESGIAKVNAVRAVNQVVKENLLGWIFVDNSRLAQVHGDLGVDRYYEEINKAIVEPLDSMNKLNDRQGVTSIRTLDGEDFRTLVLSGGILNFASNSLNKLTVDSVVQTVRDSVQYSNIMPEGFALEHVSYMGLVIEAPETLLHEMPYSFFEQINEQLKDESRGAAIYMGIYKLPPDSKKAHIRMMCSSQALPEGIQEMVSTAKREGGQLRDKLQQGVAGLDLGDIEEYELFRTSPSMIRRRIPEQSRAQRSAPAAQPSGSVKPAPAASTTPAPSTPAPGPSEMATKSKPKTKKAKKDKPAESLRPAASIPPPAKATAADREAYDQMVKDFKSSQDDSVRQRVTLRLESDRQSDNSLIRYYAVRAMTKLDPELFSSSLQSATQDEDATVRAIATKALSRA